MAPRHMRTIAFAVLLVLTTTSARADGPEGDPLKRSQGLRDLVCTPGLLRSNVRAARTDLPTLKGFLVDRELSPCWPAVVFFIASVGTPEAHQELARLLALDIEDLVEQGANPQDAFELAMAVPAAIGHLAFVTDDDAVRHGAVAYLVSVASKGVVERPGPPVVRIHDRVHFPDAGSVASTWLNEHVSALATAGTDESIAALEALAETARYSEQTRWRMRRKAEQARANKARRLKREAGRLTRPDVSDPSSQVSW